MSPALISAIALWCSNIDFNMGNGKLKVDTCRAELYQCVKNSKGPMKYDHCFLNQKLNK